MSYASYGVLVLIISTVTVVQQKNQNLTYLTYFSGDTRTKCHDLFRESGGSGVRSFISNTLVGVSG